MIASATIRIEYVFLPAIGHRKEAPEQTAVEPIFPSESVARLARQRRQRMPSFASPCRRQGRSGGARRGRRAPTCCHVRTELSLGRLVQPFDLEVSIGSYWLTSLKSKAESDAMRAFRLWVVAEAANSQA
jgi:DNA-binding transcriptional LysR family regulator